MKHRYVTGHNPGGGQMVSVDTDDDTEADRAAADYGKRQGWAAIRVKRGAHPFEGQSVIAVPLRERLTPTP